MTLLTDEQWEHFQKCSQAKHDPVDTIRSIIKNKLVGDLDRHPKVKITGKHHHLKVGCYCLNYTRFEKRPSDDLWISVITEHLADSKYTIRVIQCCEGCHSFWIKW